MYQLSLSTCMYEILRWHDMPERVFFQDFFFRGYLQSQRFLVITCKFLITSLWLSYNYRAIGSLWSLRNVYDRHYDLVNCHGWARIFSALRSQSMSFLVHHIRVQLVEQLLLTLFSNFVLKGLGLLILFYFFYALLPMIIVCVFVFSLFTIIFAVFLRIKIFK